MVRNETVDERRRRLEREARLKAPTARIAHEVGGVDRDLDHHIRVLPHEVLPGVAESDLPSIGDEAMAEAVRKAGGYTESLFANPYIVCGSEPGDLGDLRKVHTGCGLRVTGMTGVMVNVPCGHAGVGWRSVCASWSPVDGCRCEEFLGGVSHLSAEELMDEDAGWKGTAEQRAQGLEAQ